LLGEKATNLYIAWVLEGTDFWEGEAVAGLEDVVVVEVVEDNMVVGRKVVDCTVGKVVGIMVDSMGEVPEAFGVDSLSFADLAFGVRHWQHKGNLGILVEIRHGPPCRPLEHSFLDIRFQTFYCH
jgi:hypothetical protein